MDINEFKEKYLLTIVEIAKYCGCSRGAVNQWLLRGCATDMHGFNTKINNAMQILKDKEIKYPHQAFDILMEE